MIESITDVLQFLDQIPSFKAEGRKAADFSLGRFEKFCDLIENPQQELRCIHVAGSNGKGSTCRLIASMYRNGGYDVGLYTSPHILDYHERFAINGEHIPEADLVTFFQLYDGLIRSLKLTYFEISTALAFWWFARQKVDVAVIETGLGGRLDATNIITPIISVITTITLDHTDLLGDTIEAIAAEKAGIIKHNVPVVLGNVPEETVPVFQQQAQEKSAPIYTIDNLKPEFEGGNFALTDEEKTIKFSTSLQMPVQAHNIAMAWKVSTVLRETLPLAEQSRIAGVEEVGNEFPVPAQFEKLHQSREWYFDGAHNVQAVREMKKMVETKRPVKQTILVLSVMHDKINEKMMSEFSEFKKIIYHTLPLGRAATFDDVQVWLPHVQPFPVKKTSRKSLLKEFESELVIFAGSFYFYATVRDWLSS